MWAIVIPWIGIGLTLCLINPIGCGLQWNQGKCRSNWQSLTASFLFLAIGTILFMAIGVTKYFHSVKFPIIFFLFTPIAEELIFRGWVYRQVEKHWKWPVMVSAVLFGLHHLQYFGYQFTTFAIFQIVYTFILGIILGKMRKDSGSIYLPLFAHIILNWMTLMY